MSQAASAPVSTLKSPVLDNHIQDSKPSKDGLIIGITCGVLGFLAILVIFIVVGIKLRKKKKARDDSGFGDPTSCSNAQLLADGDSQINILQKYASPLDSKKSTSCPDIYQVNKSILLKIGPTAHAYEQLEQTSMAGSIRYKSEDRMAANLANVTSYSGSLGKLGNDERDGKIFDDDGHIYHLPSISNTFRRKSDCRIETQKHDSDLFLISHGSKIPLYLHEDGSVEQVEVESGYQSPATSSPLTSPGAFDTGNSELNFPGYQTPNSGSPRVMPKNKNSDVIGTGYRTPTSNSPKLIPKSVPLTPGQIKQEVLEHDDNIYDVPKVDESNSIYSNIPARASIISEESRSFHDKKTSLDERYKSPLKIVNPNSQRSYSIGSTKEKLQRRPDNRQYQTPPNFSNSQPSLLPMNSEMKEIEVYSEQNINSQFDTSTGDMIYDVPSRCHTIDRSVLPRNTENDNDTLLIRSWSDKDKRSMNTEILKSNYIDLDKLLSEKRNSGLIVKQYVVNEDGNIDHENETDTIYDVPSRCHTIDRTSNTPMNDNIIISQNHNFNSNIEKTEQNYIDPDRLHRKSNSHIDNNIRRGSDERKKSNREKTYDVPNSRLDRTPSNEDGATYLNITSSTMERRRSDALVKKIGYDVPSTTPVFDPSQPSLLKLASQHIYKNIDTAPHHQNKFPAGRTSQDKPVHVPEYDPSGAYSTRPMNKKISNNQGNRSKYFTEDESIYDVPSNNKLATTQHLPDTVSSESNEGTKEGLDESDNDAIYQNVFQLEDGQPRLRTYKSSGQVC